MQLEKTSGQWQWSQTILGELASKSNSRRIIRQGGFTRSIKSQKALDYADGFLRQARRPRTPFLGLVRLSATIYYASRRPDLDDTLLCDCLQNAEIIGNDRQIYEKILVRKLDKARPRVEILLESLSIKE